MHGGRAVVQRVRNKQRKSERESEGREERDGRIKGKDGREEDGKGKQRRTEGRLREKGI